MAALGLEAGLAPETLVLLAEAIFASGSVILAQAPDKVVRSDHKIYDEEGFRFSVSQVEELGFSNFKEKASELAEALQQLRDVQIPQKRPQPADQIPGARHAPPRTLPRQEAAHRRSCQRLKLARLLLQEQARDPLIAHDSQQRQPALLHQVVAIVRKQLAPWPIAHDDRS